MEVVIKAIPRLTVEQFADRHGLVMEVFERNPKVGMLTGKFEPFYAHFRSSDVKEGSVLIGEFGNGQTPAEAIADYASRISNRVLVVNASTDQRRELTVPYLGSQAGIPRPAGVTPR